MVRLFHPNIFNCIIRLYLHTVTLYLAHRYKQDNHQPSRGKNQAISRLGELLKKIQYIIARKKKKLIRWDDTEYKAIWIQTLQLSTQLLVHHQ